MKGIRFYSIVENKGRKAEKHIGICLAVYFDSGYWSWNGKGQCYCYECVAPLYYERNSVVCYDGVSVEYLHEHTRRVSEARARSTHPKLFECLERI